MPTWWRCWTKAAETKKSCVTILDLSHQSLIDVPNDIFNHERTLEELYLNSNRIYDLPRQLFLCLGLKILNVCDNDLTRLPNAVQDLKNIQNLDLSKNAITVIPELSQLQHLNVLNLSLNPLDRIPDTIYNTSNITELYLNDTNLTYIVANIGKLVNLTIFEIRENKLTSLPESISRLKKLKRLDVGQNELIALPVSFGQIISLSELSLDLNYLEYLPDSIAALSNLIHLDTSFNNISNVENENNKNEDCNSESYETNISKSKKRNKNENIIHKAACKSAIQTLYLNNNNLTYLPIIIFNMKSLTTLRVEGNFLTSINSQISNLSSLEELCLNSNNLTSLPGSIGLLKQLKVLMLDDNLLECLPKELSSCECLTILSMRNNKLTHLIPDLGHLNKLTVLNVVNNRLRHLPVTILHLEEIKAIWLSATQSKPLIPLQREVYREEVVLTCVLLPQTDYEPNAIVNEIIDIKQSDAITNAQNKHINFSPECSADVEKEQTNQKQPLKLNRSPTPYPKQLKQMAKNLKAGNKASPNSEIKEARIITSLDSSNLDKFDSFVVYEQNVVIRQAKNTKSTELLEKNFDNTDTESTSNCYDGRFYGGIDKEVSHFIDSQQTHNYNTEEISSPITNEADVDKYAPDMPYSDGICEVFTQDCTSISGQPSSVTNELSEKLSEGNNFHSEIGLEQAPENSPCEHSIASNNKTSAILEILENENHVGRVKDSSQEDSVDGYTSTTNDIYDKSYNNQVYISEPENNLFMQNNYHLYSNRTYSPESSRHIEQSQQNIVHTTPYEHINTKKSVPPPYHVARNYSKHAKYYDVLHSRCSNDNSNYEQYGSSPLNNPRSNHNIITDHVSDQANSPVSVSRSHMETPLSTIDDDRYSIQNFVDNQMQEPYVIKPKAHKLTTEHGDYHYVIQNKFPSSSENNANTMPPSYELHMQHSFNENIGTQMIANIEHTENVVSDNTKTVDENNRTTKHKKVWMFGQHKNVKVVDCTVFIIDFEIEYRKDQGIFVKSHQSGSPLRTGDKLLQIGEENINQIISDLKETDTGISKLIVFLNQIVRPFNILVSRHT